MSVSVDKVVEAFVKTRDEIATIEKEMEDRIKPLKEVQTKREEWLLGEINKLGAQNIKTKHGTAFIAKKESVRVANWDSFVDWAVYSPVTEALKSLKIDPVLLSEVMTKIIRMEFFNHAVNKTATLEMMGSDRSVQPPPGIDYVAVRAVQIRKN